MARFFLASSAILGCLSVILGAFAAHVLKEKLGEYFMGVFQTGVTYQFFHVFALALVGLLFLRGDGDTTLRLSGYFFLAGVLIFSGSLYTLALSGVKAWGAVTPLGGLSFIIGWILLTKHILQTIR